uniref:CCHC-type domain-containing protein n=1 Tax=Quercus lobata TaxID=97700 RepID=A0A7N2R9M0_QUELO
MIDLGYDFFLVKFSILDDYQKALEQGPWFVGENYLSVRKWEPEFQAAKAKVSSMAVWIRLAELPIELFHPNILRVVGNTIGTFLRIDTITTSVARGRFARICVQIGLEKPLMPNITIGKFIQKIQYENIPMLCYNCGILGHTQDKCNHAISNTPIEDQAQVLKPNPAIGNPSDFGPWFIVNRRSNKSRTEGKSKPPRVNRPELISTRSLGDSPSNSYRYTYTPTPSPNTTSPTPQLANLPTDSSQQLHKSLSKRFTLLEYSTKDPTEEASDTAVDVMKVTPVETEDDDSNTNVATLYTSNVTVSCNEATILGQPSPSTTHISSITSPSSTHKHNHGLRTITSGLPRLRLTTLFSYPPPPEYQHSHNQPLRSSIHTFGQSSFLQFISVSDSSPKCRTSNSHNLTCSSPRNSNLLDCSHDTSPNDTSWASFVGLEHSTTDAESNNLPSQPNSLLSTLPPLLLAPFVRGDFLNEQHPHQMQTVEPRQTLSTTTICQLQSTRS